MPRESHALISTPMVAPVPGWRRTERLSLRAAIVTMILLSLAGWAATIALVLAII
jgi:hypothetical protein